MICPFFLYPGGKQRCVTFSYDDGCADDRRLVGIFNAHHLKATFHINSANLGRGDWNVAPGEIATLYAGHEVSCHMATHPFPSAMPDAGIVRELWEDRARLEALCGYPVRGMSFPFGDWDARTLAAMDACGIEYARAVAPTRDFHLPADFRVWAPTCHHREAPELLARFRSDFFPLTLFYVWGHAFEFSRQNNWDLIEKFCDDLCAQDDFWSATNIEIVDYVRATRALRFTTDCRQVYNPTATTVWFGDTGGETLCTDCLKYRQFKVGPGETLRIAD